MGRTELEARRRNKNGPAYYALITCVSVGVMFFATIIERV